MSCSPGPASSLENKPRRPEAWVAPASFTPLPTQALTLTAPCLARSLLGCHGSQLRCHPRGEASHHHPCSLHTLCSAFIPLGFGGLPTSEVTSQAAGATPILSAAGPLMSGMVLAHSKGLVGLCRWPNGSLHGEIEPGWA